MLAIRALGVPVFLCFSLSFNPAATLSRSSSSTSLPLQVSADPVGTMSTSSPLSSHHLHKGSLSMSIEKTIYLIRHAESLENVAYKGARNVQAAYVSRKLPDVKDVGSAFQLAFKMFKPQVMNAALSTVGKEQVSQLYENLNADNFWDNLKDAAAQKQQEQNEKGGQPALASPLLVHSPLVRAKQTAYGALLGPEHIDLQKIDGEISGDGFVVKAGVRIQELASLKEVNPAEIVADTVSPWRKQKALDYRIQEFEDWIKSRPEDIIVVVGHSVYFKRMLNLPRAFDNCDVWEAKYGMDQTDRQNEANKEKESVDSIDLPRSWKSLRRLYRYHPDAQM